MNTQPSSKTEREVEQEDLRILDELLTCARARVKGHTSEQKQRKRDSEQGRELPKRWQISPAVIKSVINLVPKLLESRRVILKMPALARKIGKQVAKKLASGAKLTSISDMLLPKPRISLT